LGISVNRSDTEAWRSIIEESSEPVHLRSEASTLENCLTTPSSIPEQINLPHLQKS
jgi:hypothetical protein